MSVNVIKNKIESEITDLTGALGKVIATFRSMKTPLIESHGKVPQATTQLDKVVDQTEAATTGMLDILEAISQREEQVVTDLKALKTEATNWSDEQIAAAITSVEEKAEANLNDVYQVMDALQFQDITSQQIQHAASVLEELELRLQSIINVVGGEEEQASGAEFEKKRVFDPNADLYEKKTEQADVDSLFSKASDS